MWKALREVLLTAIFVLLMISAALHLASVMERRKSVVTTSKPPEVVRQFYCQKFPIKCKEPEI